MNDTEHEEKSLNASGWGLIDVKVNLMNSTKVPPCLTSKSDPSVEKKM